MMNNEKLLTPVDIANRLQVNERTVTQWLRKGDLRGFKVGKEWRVSVEDLEAFLEAGAGSVVGLASWATFLPLVGPRRLALPSQRRDTVAGAATAP